MAEWLIMRRLAILAAVFILPLAGCATTSDGTDPATDSATSTVDQADFLAEHDLAGMQAQQIVDHLDRVPVAERPSDLIASVRADHLVLSDADNEVSLVFDEDGFYLSMAPYVEQTHDCFYHSLTTCRGELANEEIGVRIIDADGTILVEEQMTTFDNGFVGFWLPEDIEGTVEVAHDGRTAVSTFSTSDDGATCLTTLRLDA